MNKWIKGLAVAFICGVLLGCGGGGGSSSNVGSPPSAPTSLSVEPGDGVNTVQWPAQADATSYNIYWSETTPVTTQSSHLIANAVSPYQHTGLTNGKLIYYAVTAVNAVGESAMSTEIGAMPVAPVPAPPGTVNATPGVHMVTLDWAPVAHATSYSIHWSNAPGVAPGGNGVTKIDNIQATSYSHVGLTDGVAYYYVITAVSTGGESAASAVVSAKPIPASPPPPADTPPGAPASLTATTGDAQVHLSWSASTGATSYNVYWAKFAGVVPGAAGVTQIAGVTATSYLHTGLTNGDTYHYVVTAVEPMARAPRRSRCPRSRYRLHPLRRWA